MIEQYNFGLWGGQAHICTESSKATAALEVVQKTVSEIDQSCSAYREDSDLSRVNSADGRWTSVSNTFIDVLGEAVSMAEATQGLADPTVGTVTLAARMPVAISVLGTSDWRGVEIDQGFRRVRLREGLALDLGAIAKARCADLAASAAHSVTGQAVLVSLLGDIAVAGPAPEGGWPIICGDDHRDSGSEGPSSQVCITAGGLATSSLTVRRSRRGNHVMDPRTHRPVRGPLRTVSVAAATCSHANAAATAALVRGDSARRWLNQLGLPARLVHNDGSIETAGGWPA